MGLVAKLVTSGAGPGGFFLTAALGIAGSIIATYAGQFMGWYQAGQSAGFVGGLVGAIVLLVIYHLIIRTRTSRFEENIMGFDLGAVLRQYLGRGANQPTADAADHYQQVAQSASPEVVSQGLAEAFRSDQTPPFAQMIGQLFNQASPQQQAGMLNQLLGGLGPGALAALTQTGALGGLAGQLGGGNAISPQQAAQLSPDQVQQIAAHAENHNPGIVDQMSDFYAQHLGLVKTLGGAALTIALAKIANNMKG